MGQPNGRTAAPDLIKVLEDQQAQIDDLTAVLERHQALFEKLAREGRISPDDVPRGARD